MQSFDGDFGLVGPAADKLADPAAHDRARLGVDEQLGTSLRANQLPYSFTTSTTSAGSLSIGRLRGQDNVGRRSSPALANGFR